MSFLGGIDLSGAAKLALTRELESRRRAVAERFALGKGYVYRGGADLCLQHGKYRPGRILPDDYRHLSGLDGRTCYYDALRAALADPTVRYCEGYAAVGRGHFISHAWCIAPDDGVLEVRYPTDEAIATVTLPTLVTPPPQKWSYWGVTFRAELVEAHTVAPLHLGMLDRSRAEELDMLTRFTEDEVITTHDFPILKVPYDPERTTL